MRDVRCKYYIDKRNPLGCIKGVMIKSFKHKGLEDFFARDAKEE